MMVKVKSPEYWAIRKRIQRLPKMATDLIKTSAKRDAELLVKEFHDGIKKDKFGLLPLKDRTISRKEALGLSQPETPLYGLGDDFVQGTYCNMMEVIEEPAKRMYLVKPRDGYHYSLKKDKDGFVIGKDKIKLADLFIVHEYGCTINNGFGRGIFIRIPPRPALRLAFDSVLKSKARKEPADEVRKAIREYIKTGNESAMRKIAEREKGSE
jgi:hypothetical protein